MICIKIDNSVCVLKGFTAPQLRALRKLVSYRDMKASRRFGKGGVRKALIDKRGIFPTGLLYLVEWYYRTNRIPFTTADFRVRPKAVLGLYKMSLS